MFSQKGYDATSVREICEAAEITKPTLYHFYGSKEGVYHAIVEGALEDFRQRLVGQIEARGSPRERLKRVARDYFEHARERRQLMRFLFGLIHNPPSSAPMTDFPRFYEDIVALISRVAEEGVRDGSSRPAPPTCACSSSWARSGSPSAATSSLAAGADARACRPPGRHDP